MLRRWRPLVCSIARLSWAGAQHPTGRAAWVGCVGVHEQRRLVRAKRIQEAVVGRDERLLLLGVELAPDDFRLVIFEAKPMQQGDQPLSRCA